MKNLKYLFLSVLMVSFVFTSCKKDVVDEAQTLVEFLESADSPLGKDYVSTDMPAIITATDVNSGVLAGTVAVLDIRAADAFADGHIESAVNVAADGVLDYLAANDLSGKDVVAIVCYSGQTAAFVTCLARISGYDNVKSMKWGMCSWNAATSGSWTSSVSNTYATQITTDATAKNAEGNLPTLSTGLETGQEILDNRIATVNTDGFGAAKITAAEVWANPDNYYIVNYWSEAHYTDPGHIPGAVQYTPKVDMQLAESLKTLPTDKTIVCYCYTGQTSANLAAYLRVLGYDAKSLLFGSSGMFLDLVSRDGYAHWDDAYIGDFPLVK